MKHIQNDWTRREVSHLMDYFVAVYINFAFNLRYTNRTGFFCLIRHTDFKQTTIFREVVLYKWKTVDPCHEPRTISVKNHLYTMHCKVIHGHCVNNRQKYVKSIFIETLSKHGVQIGWRHLEVEAFRLLFIALFKPILVLVLFFWAEIMLNMDFF